MVGMSIPGSKPAGALLALADQCVQCGLCLPHCPTYRLDAVETESPRSRVAYMRAVLGGQLAATPVGDLHLDHCLGCRRCESACPAGVRYGALLAGGRESQQQRAGSHLRGSLALWLLRTPLALSMLLASYRRLYRLLPRLFRPLPRPPRASPRQILAEEIGPAIFIGCIASRYEAPARTALHVLLRAVGVAACEPAGQACKVVDAIAFLEARASGLRFRPAHGRRIALHVPCTQATVVRSDGALRRLLAMVPGLDVVELADGGCCGSAGLHMLQYPTRAAALREPMLQALTSSGAKQLLSANIGRRLHLQNGTRVPVRHPAEFLAEQLA